MLLLRNQNNTLFPIFCFVFHNSYLKTASETFARTLFLPFAAKKIPISEIFTTKNFFVL